MTDFTTTAPPLHSIDHANAVSAALSAVIAAEREWIAASDAAELAGPESQYADALRSRVRIARHTFDTAAQHLAAVQALPPPPAPVNRTAPAQTDRRQQAPPPRNANVSVRRRQPARRQQRQQQDNACANCGLPSGAYDYCYACHEFPDREIGVCYDCGAAAKDAYARCWNCHQNAGADA